MLISKITVCVFLLIKPLQLALGFTSLSSPGGNSELNLSLLLEPFLCSRIRLLLIFHGLYSKM